MPLPAKYDAALGRVVDTLKQRLGDNLHSLVLYGSAVRGAIVEDVSDVNLLVVLEASTPEAHAVIAQAVRGKVPIDPFILGRRGLARALQVFAIKFRSIRRDYRVLHGADPLVDFEADPALLRTLCEQQLQNLLLRSAHAFVVFGAQGERYAAFLRRNEPMLFIVLSELVRLAGGDVPHEFSERTSVIARTLETDASVLETLRELHDRPRKLSSAEVFELHARLYRLLEHAVGFLEARWPSTAS